MLEQILSYINNYFEVNIVKGDYTIEDGSLTLDFLQNGQYFRICGSVFNDGVYQYPASDLTDEKFEGEVWAMAVPPAVIALTNDIQAWENKYVDVVSGPYQSESFGGYSYSKGSNSSGNPIGWRDVFHSRLNRWRKI